MDYLLQVTSRPVEGRDEEFNHWYDNTHVHEVLALPGFKACSRFVREIPGEAPEYIAYYEMETDDPNALLNSLFAAVPTMQMTDALDTSTATFQILRPHGQRALSANG